MTIAPVKFTIRGVVLEALPDFQDSDWLGLQRWCIAAPLDVNETVAGRKRLAWESFCEMVPEAAEQPWHRDGKIALDVSELGTYLMWATRQIEARSSFTALMATQRTKAKTGFSELLAEKGVGMVNLDAEDVSDQIPLELPLESMPDSAICSTPDRIQTEIAFETQAVEDAAESPDAVRQGEIERLEGELARLRG